MAFGVGGNGTFGSWGQTQIGQTAQNQWNNNLYTAGQTNATKGEPPAPSDLSGGATDPNELIAQMKFAMWLQSQVSGGGANALNYALYTPQEMAQRGLSLDSMNRGALDSQGAYIGAEGRTNTLKNQLAGQSIAAQRDQALQQALIDRHSAQGQMAAAGSGSSQIARDTLGNQGNQDYYAAMGNTNPAQPWVGNGKGTIQNQLDFTLKDLYRQAVGTQADYSLAQTGLYNQVNQLTPQYGQLGQNDDAYNRLLNGQYNTNVTPEMRALMAALGQAT